MADSGNATVPVSFLTTGPRFNCAIPAPFVPLPQMSSPIDIGEGRGRSCEFIPYVYETDPRTVKMFVQIGVDEGADGRRVEIYERNDKELWFLRWPLKIGALLMHVRAVDDGIGDTRRIPRSLRILEGVDGIPAVVPDPPLRRAVSARRSYQEKVMFFAPNPTDPKIPFGPYIELRRPGSLLEGRTRHQANNGLGRGAPFGVEVTLSQAGSEGEAERVVDQVVTSLAGA